MNFLFKTYNKLKHLFIISVISLSVMSCGGETIATAGISGTGIVFGVITGFGSIFVNGVEYETDTASFDVDGNRAATQEQLKVGMVVKLDTTSFTDGTFEANNVVYDDSIEGPITSTVALVPGQTQRKEFTVMGVQVVINASTTSFHDSTSFTPAVSFDNLKQGDVIEVSGFVVDATTGKINATLIEKKDELPSSGTIPPVPVEIHVTVPNPAPVPGPTGSFSVFGLTINYDSNTEFDDLPNGLLAGLAVEVKGLYDSGSNSIQATEIEGEDDDGIIGSGGSGSSPISLSLQGLIVGIDATQTMFTINGIPVQVDSSVVPASIISQLVEGMNVEVEGIVQNGVLMADQVEIREGNSEYKAQVQARDLTARTLNIAFPGVSGTILLQLDSQSIIEDENRNPITLSDVLVSDDIKVHAREVNNSEWTVVSLRRQRNEFDSYEISGEIDAINPGSNITIDGLVFPLDTTSPPSPPVLYDPLLPSSPDIPVGTLIELEDNDRDGEYDEVSVYVP